ncbi:MAG: lipopolysaccharide heptosyltransferase II [Chloroflexi bacterium]|nr:lipopolysaccharide heptosyltransferase II [Chloroflexota bacterium]
MDKAALATRNRRLAARLHQRSFKHRLRNGLLRLIAYAPAFTKSSRTNRILIIRPDHLGDMILTTPAIKALKRQRPELSIHVLCGGLCAALLENYDEVDQILTLPFPGFGRAGSIADNAYRLALNSARQLRRIGYDSALIMRPDHWWGALLAYLAGIPQRIGYDLEGLSPFLTESRAREHQHAVLQNLRLVEAFGPVPPADDIQLDFPLRAADCAAIDNCLADWEIPAERPLVCIHPGSGAASKLWRNENWAVVADAVARDFKAAIVFTGTAEESEIIDDIAAKMERDAANLAGATTVGQLAALYRRSLAALGPDSGAMHLAAAVHTPTVTLFGPADPIEFAPWGDPKRHVVVRSDIACAPCRILDWRADDPKYHPCVRDVGVEQVLRAAHGVLGG